MSNQEDINPRRLFVHNLEFQLGQHEIKDAFEPFGRITDCHIPLKNGKPRGYALIEFEREEHARAALQELDGKPLLSRKIVITVSPPALTAPVRPPRAAPRARPWR